MNYLFACALLLAAFACNPPKETDHTSTDTLPARTDSAPMPPTSTRAAAKVELVTEQPLLDSLETPHAVVRLLVDNQEVWRKQVVGNWNKFDKDQFQYYNVPETAVTAYQSWWAGSGDIFYLIQENGKWVVRSCELPETEGDQEVTLTYKTEKEVPLH